jgi:hypothetical protein
MQGSFHIVALSGGEMPNGAESTVGWERGAAGDVGKNLIEADSLSLSENASCRKPSRFDIIQKTIQDGGCYAERLYRKDPAR